MFDWFLLFKARKYNSYFASYLILFKLMLLLHPFFFSFFVNEKVEEGSVATHTWPGQYEGRWTLTSSLVGIKRIQTQTQDRKLVGLRPSYYTTTALATSYKLLLIQYVELNWWFVILKLLSLTNITNN